MKSLQPGSTIGIIGGGQLGRMMAVAAAQLGFKCHIYSPEKDCPAEQVSDKVTHDEFENVSALREFASKVDVVTYEFENIPVSTIDEINKLVNVFPNARVLEISQDRLSEKEFINSLGVATAPYVAVSSLNELKTAVEETGLPAVLKTRRLGYDGKGQVIIRSKNDITSAWEQLNNEQLILEGFIDFNLEISVIAARGQNGDIKCFVPVENEHKNHILDLSIAPARVEEKIQKQATEVAKKIITNIDYVGILTVEFFVSDKEPVLRVNEIAPRVHNSGHWTIEACPVSQFEQHIRAVCGLPLGKTEFSGRAEMTNLIGDDILKIDELISEPGAHVHHYGKSDVRAGRKMGHVTRVFR